MEFRTGVQSLSDDSDSQTRNNHHQKVHAGDQAGHLGERGFEGLSAFAIFAPRPGSGRVFYCSLTTEGRFNRGVLAAQRMVSKTIVTRVRVSPPLPDFISPRNQGQDGSHKAGRRFRVPGAAPSLQGSTGVQRRFISAGNS